MTWESCALAGRPIFVLRTVSRLSFQENDENLCKGCAAMQQSHHHKSLGIRTREQQRSATGVQSSPEDGRNCPLFLSDEQAKGGTGKTIGLAELVFQEAKICGRDVGRMADK